MSPVTLEHHVLISRQGMKVDPKGRDVANIRNVNRRQITVHPHMTVEVPDSKALYSSPTSDSHLNGRRRGTEVRQTFSGSVDGGVTPTVQTN